MKKIKPISKIIMLTGLILNLQLALSQENIKIGEQTWTTKNLDVTTFRNGDVIAEANDGKEWKEAKKKGKPAWCYYNNDSKNEKYLEL